MVYIIVLFLLSLSSTFAQDLEHLYGLSDLSERWTKLFSVPEMAPYVSTLYGCQDKYDQIRRVNSSHFRQLLFSDSLLALLHSNGDSPLFYPKCSEDLVQILFNLKSEYALKMLDSNGKPRSGLLLGGTSWPGNYRECKSVYAPLDDHDRGNFYGQYCVASWSLGLSDSGLQISTGLCVPDSCTGDDVLNAVAFILRLSGHVPLLKQYSSLLSLKSVTCKVGAGPLDGAGISLMVVISLIIFLVFLGSTVTVIRWFLKSEKPCVISTSTPQGVMQPAYTSIQNTSVVVANKSGGNKLNECENAVYNEDVLIENAKPEVAVIPKRITSKGFSGLDVLLCFCAFTNGGKILNVDTSGSQFRSVHGVRFLSMTWVIMGHTYIMAAAYISNMLNVLTDIDTFAFQMVLQAPFSVDSFFLLSGMLLAYLFLKEADKRCGKINWIYFYLHRIWRLTPVFMLVVGFYMVLFKHVGDGPFWIENQGDSCRHTWWWYLLYINNFIPIKDMCVGWTWYLANDMQFYVISPLFLYTLWRWPKVGIFTVLCLLVGSFVSTGVLASVDNITPFLAGTSNIKNATEYQIRMWETFDIVYDKPYCRIGPYLIGVLLGYALYKAGNRKKFLRFWHRSIGWLLAGFFSVSVVFGLYHVDLTKGISVSFVVFSRTSFTMGLAWVIFACETGHGGLVSKFLEMKFWIPLSRLTYCAYLIHLIVINAYYQGLYAPLYFTHITMVIHFLGFLVVAYALSFFVSIIFESPMMNVEKLLLNRSK